MSKLIHLGKQTEGNKPVDIDLPVLIASRLLIQARSGGGKSWALRYLLEQTHGKVQQIVIDPEGEFYTLREKFDYIIAGKGYDIAPKTEHIDKFGQRILDLGISCIFDLYELPRWEQERFVKNLIFGLLKAPKATRHPVLIVIDEAQLFAPEDGSAESRQAVIDLCTMGRKRGLCPCLATQRIAQVSKHATAQLANKLVGSTFQDIDQVRAGKELGMIKSDYITLRNLKPGQFHSFGSAIRLDNSETDKIVTLKIGPVQTKHPEIGSTVSVTSQEPTKSILMALKELADVPVRAEEEAKSSAELKRVVAELRRKLTLLESSQAVPEKITSQIQELKEQADQWKKRHDQCERNRANAVRVNKYLVEQIRKRVTGLSDFLGSIDEEIDRDDRMLKELPVPQETRTLRTVTAPVTPVRNTAKIHLTELPEGIAAPHKKILDTLGRFESLGFTSPKVQVVAAMAGYSHGGGAWNNYKGRLNSLGLISVSAGVMRLTDEGRKLATIDGDSLTLEQLHDNWLSLYSAPIQKMLRVIIDAYPGSISKEDLGARTDYEPKGGAFNNYLGRLRATGAVVNDGHGKLKASDLVFPEGLS